MYGEHRVDRVAGDRRVEAMTERNTSKLRRSEESRASAKPLSGAAAQAEIERLRSELAAANARIADLEQKHTDVINRIDWVIDSLHNLTQ
jgi:ubiquinone biosynthesis protein UbiJ